MRDAKKVFQLIVAGYARTGRNLLYILGIVATAAAFALIISWPLWYFAVHIPRLYSLVVVILLPVGAVVYGIYTHRDRYSLVRVVKGLLIFLLCTLVLLLAIFLFLTGNIAAGTIVSAVFLLVSGYFSYGRR